MTGDKIRFRFRKGGALRLISHLDTMRCFERMLRRAAIPFRLTQGFHPYPRLVLAQSLPLGVTGVCEVGELELTTPHDVFEIQNRLNNVAPPGLELYDSRPVDMKATAIARRVVYAVDISDQFRFSARGKAADRLEQFGSSDRGHAADRLEDFVEAAKSRAAKLLAQEKVWAERIKPRPRGLNIRPYIRDLRVLESRVEFDLWVTGGGTARSDELLRLMDLEHAELNVVRSVLDIRDETEPMPGEPPIDHPADVRPPQAVTVTARRESEETPAAPSWGLSPAGPVVE